MSKILGIIGAFVVSMLLIACPVIMTVAFLCEWHSFVKWILLMIVLVEAIGLFSHMVAEVED